MKQQKYYQRFKHFHKMDLNKIESFKIIKEWVEGKKTLDIGCGLGHLTNFWQAQGIDVNDYTIKIARKFFPKSKFSCVDASKMPFSNSSYQTIICYNVLEHIPDNKRGKVYSEIKRVLKPNGVFIAGYIDEGFWLNKVLSFLRPDRTHVVSWTPIEFKKEIASQFKIIETRKTSCYGRFNFLTKNLKGEIIFKCLLP